VPALKGSAIIVKLFDEKDEFTSSAQILATSNAKVRNEPAAEVDGETTRTDGLGLMDCRF